MPTELGPPFPPDYTGLPTHMSTEDWTIWQKYRQRHRTAWRQLYFDVRLGTGRPIPPGADKDLETMWTRSTQKRADVIAITADALHLIELRSNAQLNAIGRLLGYVHLLEEDNPFSLPIQAILVTDNDDPDVRLLASRHNILYEVVAWGPHA